MKKTHLFYFLLAIFSVSACQTSQKVTDVANLDKVASMKKYEGFFNYYWDAKEGKIWIHVDKLDKEFLYVNSLAAGVGSNDIGLDRGQLVEQNLSFCTFKVV